MGFNLNEQKEKDDADCPSTALAFDAHDSIRLMMHQEMCSSKDNNKILYSFKNAFFTSLSNQRQHGSGVFLINVDCFIIKTKRGIVIFVFIYSYFDVFLFLF